MQGTGPETAMHHPVSRSLGRLMHQRHSLHPTCVYLLRDLIITCLYIMRLAASENLQANWKWQKPPCVTQQLSTLLLLQGGSNFRSEEEGCHKEEAKDKDQICRAEGQSYPKPHACPKVCQLSGCIALLGYNVDTQSRAGTLLQERDALSDVFCNFPERFAKQFKGKGHEVRPVSAGCVSPFCRMLCCSLMQHPLVIPCSRTALCHYKRPLDGEREC